MRSNIKMLIPWWNLDILHVLYLMENKYIYNIFSKKNLLNKGNELVTKCRHENEFYLANYKNIPP